MNDSKVTVIVPCYNVEEYLAASLESLIAQTYSNIEILCIDDFSTDASVEIVTAFQKKDSKIRLLQQTHKGVSAARNFGIREASGEYIVFLDADDWLEPDAVEKMIFHAEKTNADVVVCSSEVHFEQDNTDGFRRRRSLCRALSVEERLWSRENTDCDIWQFMEQPGVWPFVWNKLIRRSLITENNIMYPIGLALGEDGVFLHLMFRYAERVAFLPDRLHHYRYQRKNSATINHFQSTAKRFDHHMRVVSIMFREFVERELINQDGAELLKWCVVFLYSDFVRLSAEKQKETVPMLQTLFQMCSSAVHLNQLDRITKKRLDHMTCASRKFTEYTRKKNLLCYKIDNVIMRLLNIHHN